MTNSIIFWTMGFGSGLHRHIVGNPRGINCAHPVADLFLFIRREISNNGQAGVIKAINSTSSTTYC